jgi:hypothetical protein
MNAVAKEVSVTIVPPIHLRMVWEQVEPFLEPAIERSNGRWTLEAMYDEIATGKKNLWLVFEGNSDIECVAVTQVIKYPGKTMLSIDFLGGTGIDKWAFKLLDVLNSFAQDAGCSGLEAVARDGFQKWLGQNGFERSCAFFEKRI